MNSQERECAVFRLDNAQSSSPPSLGNRKERLKRLIERLFRSREEYYQFMNRPQHKDPYITREGCYDENGEEEWLLM